MPILTCSTPLILRSYNDDGFPTKTSEQQSDVENIILDLFGQYKDELAYEVAQEGDSSSDVTISTCETEEIIKKDISRILLSVSSHKSYLISALNSLPWGFQVLDASKPFMIYWIVHSLDLLGFEFDQQLRNRIISTLLQLQHPSGGFRGGSAQIPHLAPTFAAISTIAILKESSGFELIDREKNRDFLKSLKTPEGAWRMCQGGEIDVRGSYCALVSASLLNILDEELLLNVPEFLLRCQTYEGGIAGYPGTEAHGGYTHCALAALEILGRVGDLQFDDLIRWLTARQLNLEGGFSGRTNKLVDGCYSFWVGGCFGIVEAELKRRGITRNRPLFDREALQEYVLVCCQAEKGLRDKPGKSPDYYHTCYCLSGLSVAQNFFTYVAVPENAQRWGCSGQYVVDESSRVVVGRKTNHVKAVHPVYNIALSCVDWVKEYWRKKGEKVEW